MKNTQDLINPDHYKKGGFEVIDVIEAYNLGFNLGNTVKYILRKGEKEGNPPLQELKKAKWYLEREISNLEKEEKVEGLKELIREDELLGFTEYNPSNTIEDYTKELNRRSQESKYKDPYFYKTTI